MACVKLYRDGKSFWCCGNFDPMELQDDSCRVCGEFAPEFLCDFPVGDNKTCDRALCKKCANEIAPEIHYCDHHFEEWKKFRKKGGVKKSLENVVPYKTCNG